MLDLRPFASLGRFRNDWLNAHYHFSFSGYHDAKRMGWGPLRVWNDDAIRAGTGFPPHGHRDMEIITYVRSGAISHGDSLGNRGRTEAGQVQVMSAGQGIQHSEINAESVETTLFQIWLFPRHSGLPPRWETRDMPVATETGTVIPLISGDGRDGTMRIDQDAVLSVLHLMPGQSVTHHLGLGLGQGKGKDRLAYLVGVEGQLSVGTDAIAPLSLSARDGLAVAEEAALHLTGAGDQTATVLLMDMAA